MARKMMVGVSRSAGADLWSGVAFTGEWWFERGFLRAVPGHTVDQGPLQNEPFLQHCDMQTLAIQEGSGIMMQSYPFFFLFLF